MRLISDVVYDLEIEHTKFDLDKEFEKVENDDHNFIRLIQAGEDKLTSKAVYAKNGIAYVKLEDSFAVMRNAILSIRHILISQINITRLERPEKPIPKLKPNVEKTAVKERRPWW